MQKTKQKCGGSPEKVEVNFYLNFFSREKENEEDEEDIQETLRRLKIKTYNVKI
jgi:hypothetical protein